MLLTVAPPALPNEVRVASITYTPEDLGRRKNPLYITVSVVDAVGAPVSGAKVVARIRKKGGRKWRRKGFTGADGRVTLKIGRSPHGCFVTNVLKVRSVGLTWDHLTPGNTFCQ
jgi:hypothetical protein